MKKLLLFVIACTLGLFGTVSAQETITIGEGGTTNAALPVDFYNGYGICQQIFLADEINHADGGTITSMAIKFFGETMSGSAENPTNTTFERNVDIYINSTELTELTGGVDLSAGQTPYFQGTVTYVPEEWTEFVFDTPYQYEGGNIIITMHDYTGGDYQNYYHFYADFAEKRAVYANITSKLTNEYLENSLSQVLWNSPSRNNIQLTFSAAGEGGGEEPTPEPEPTPTIPSHPASMTATVNGQNSITLTWEAVEGATSYNIYSAAGNVGGVTATEYTYEGLTAGTYYCFEVTAENAAGESYDSAYGCATTEAAPVEPTPEPGVPEQPETNDVVVTIGDASAENTNSSANYPFCNTYTYSHTQQIYSSAVIKSYNNNTIPEGNITKIKYYIAEGSQEYFGSVKVYMRNSDLAAFTGATTAEAKLAWDKDFTADDLVFEGDVDVVDNAIEMTLSKPFAYDGTKNLIIYVDVDTKNGTAATKFRYTKTFADGTAFTDKGLLYYRNQNNNAGLGNWTTASGSPTNYLSVVSLTFASEGGGEEPTPEPEPTVPAAPVVEATVTETTVTLTWEAVENATSYNIYTPSGFDSNVLGLTETTYTFEGLTAGTYCFEVSAGNEAGESDATEACATIEAAPEEPTEPEEPAYNCMVIVTMEDTYGDGWGSNYLLVSYNETTEQFNMLASSYGAADGKLQSHTLEIPQGTSVKVTYTSYNNGWGEENSFTVKYDSGKEILSVPAGTFGNTATTAEYEFVTDCTPEAPGKPEISAKTSGDKTIDLTFTAVGAESYTIYNGTETVATGVTENVYTVEGLSSETNYCFTVRAVNLVGESEVSETACATTYKEGTAVVQIGEGTDHNTYVTPVYDYSLHSISQTIYTAEEIGGAGQIKSVSYNKASGANNTRNIAIYMKNVDREDLHTFETLTSDLCVYNGEFTFGKPGWVEIELQEGFVYEGGNLLVCVVDNTNVSASSYDKFYTYATGVLRAVYGSNNQYNIDPLNLGALYVNGVYDNNYSARAPQTKFVIEPAPADVKVVPETIALGEVKVGECWSENVGSAAAVTVRPISTTVTNITCDNDFFVLPAEIDYTANPIEFEVTYNKNAAAGEQTGNLTITYGDGATKVVPMTATAYAPVTPDVFELAQEITFTENAYTDTPVFANLKDDYNMPAEEGANAPDAVYAFELTKASMIEVNVTGTNANYAIYRAEDLAGNGPKADNNYTGESESAGPLFFYNFSEENVLDNFTLIDKNNDGYNWITVYNGIDSYSLKSESYTSGTTLYPDNYIVTKEKYEITANTVLSFKYLTSTYPDKFGVEVSTDGENFEDVWNIKTASGYQPVEQVVPLSAYAGQSIYIALRHYESNGNEGYYVLIDDLKLESVAPSIFPAGNYYLVAAAEDAFTVNVAIEALEDEPTPVAPAAPEVVNVESVTESTITLTWNTVEGATSYNVYSVDFDTTYVTFVVDSSYTATGLDAYTEYCFAVAAVSEDSLVSAKTTQCAKTSDLTIVAPVVEAEAISATEIVLAWNAVENALSYNVYQGETLLGNVTETTFTVEGLASYTDYSFTVSAVRNEQEVVSEVASARTLDLFIAVPANLVAEATSATEIVLTWEAVENAMSYVVYQGEDSIANITETTFTVEGLDPYTDYSFTVTALRNEQEMVSEAVTAKTLDLTIAAPVVAAEATSATEIVLTWEAAENALSYNVYNDTVLVANVTSTTFTVEGLASYTDYSFTVSALRNEQEVVSEVASARTLDLVVAAPANLVAEATSISEIVLTWEAVENAFSYVVYQGEDSIANVTDTTFTVEGLASYTDYSFTVSALRNEQEVVSEVASARTLDLVVTAPANLLAEATSISEIVLTWEAAENALSYNVYNDTVLVANVTSTTFTVEGLASYTDYSFTVSALRNEQEVVSEVASARTLDLVVTAPANLVAEATSISEIVLTWEAAENALSYNVYNDTVLVANVTDTTFTVEGLDVYTEYSFTVTALRNEQEMVSEAVSAKTLDLTIVAPVVVAEATSATEIVLTWEAVENAFSYVVYQGEDSIANVTDTTFAVEGLDPYTDYSFTVTALRNEQEMVSEAVSAKTLDLTIVAPVVVAEATSATEIVLTWEAVENAMSYVVYQGEDSIANITETTFTVTGLDVYTEYSFTVTALRNAQAETSAVVTAKTLDLTIVAPVVVAEATSATEIVLTWEAVENAMSYVVYQGEDSIANVTDTTFTVEGLDVYTDYSFTVTALRNAQAETSAVVTAKTLDLTIVAPVVVAEATSDTTIVLTWNAVENATSYNVYNDSVLVVNLTDTTFTVKGLTAETDYSFTVSALRNEQEVMSETVSAKTLAGEPVVPEPVVPEAPVVEAEATSDTTIVLTWNAVEGATSYNVYNDTVLVENVTDTIYVVTGLEAATEYCFTVTAVNKAGESEASEKACATTLPEGVAEAEFSFTIYPNPVDNMLTIDTDSYIEEVTIYSLTGVMMYKEVDFNNHTIDVSDFSCGVYVMKVRTDNGESVKRFIKK